MKKKTTIEITVEFGSAYQSKFARDSLFMTLKAWRNFIKEAHQKNKIDVTINGDAIQNLEWFNWLP